MDLVLPPASMTIIAVRAVQGLGGALLFPATLSPVNTLFAEGRPRNRALAVWGGAGAGGLTLGSLLGGVLTGAFGWASVFFVNVPLALAIGLAAFVLIPADRPRAVAIAVGTQVGERMTSRHGTRTSLITGFVMGGVGTVGLAFGVVADGMYWGLVPGLVVMGVGQGIAWTAMWIAAASGVAQEEQSIASGMASTTQQIGYAIGLAVFVAIAKRGHARAVR
ncbi:MFS family permease [Saccharothrix ecbatanensis]|uniref:MFS family permease n=1 Tax=Saccharothrix ecbatanensis TaxID=1105145 RepID=A0A7W9HIE1_9PSEU|nr:MFS transporter [Saccharothrix ecbatanensis]MBB5802770.1 MFS family permease [Saccharothrix ecbatanensis]